jgi:hypothetical protein
MGYYSATYSQQILIGPKPEPRAGRSKVYSAGLFGGGLLLRPYGQFGSLTTVRPLTRPLESQRRHHFKGNDPSV